MADGKKIDSFEQLTAWQEAQNLAVMIYSTTKSFPKEELFGITNQIRRSATSVSANIAEGFGRKTSKDKLHFYVISYGSVLETKNFIYLSEKLGYISSAQLDTLLKQTVSCQKLLNALMKVIRE
jgi:four helix bundle protein